VERIAVNHVLADPWRDRASAHCLCSIEASAGARLGFAEDVKAVEMSAPYMPVVEKTDKALAQPWRGHEGSSTGSGPVSDAILIWRLDPSDPMQD
jgi:hypothetical protein